MLTSYAFADDVLPIKVANLSQLFFMVVKNAPIRVNPVRVKSVK
jgi:hypothetical protein